MDRMWNIIFAVFSLPGEFIYRLRHGIAPYAIPVSLGNNTQKITQKLLRDSSEVFMGSLAVWMVVCTGLSVLRIT
jgi:hypothetical protein